MGIKLRIIFSIFSILFLGLSCPILAQTDDQNEWEFALVFPMVWVTDIDGKIDFGDSSIHIERSFQDTLDTLSFGYMTELYAKKGPWRYAIKLNYAESEDTFVSKEIVLPPGIPIAPEHKIKSQTTEGTNDFTLGYQLDNGVLLFTGVRTVFSKIDVSITPKGSGIIEIEEKFTLADERLSDWIVGAEYQYNISRNVRFVLNGDVGIVGDNDTDYSINALVGYKLSKLNNIWAGYRYLRIADEFEEDGVKVASDFVTQGPIIGWVFTF